MYFNTVIVFFIRFLYWHCAPVDYLRTYGLVGRVMEVHGTFTKIRITLIKLSVATVYTTVGTYTSYTFVYK